MFSYVLFFVLPKEISYMRQVFDSSKKNKKKRERKTPTNSVIFITYKPYLYIYVEYTARSRGYLE